MPSGLLYIMRAIIEQGLERSLTTGNWDVKRFRMHRKGITQIVTRLSFIGAFGAMTKISPQFEKSRKVSVSTLGVEDLSLFSGEELHSPNSFLYHIKWAYPRKA